MRNFSYLLWIVAFSFIHNAYNQNPIFNVEHPNYRMHFKLIQSKLNDINSWLKPFEPVISSLSEDRIDYLHEQIWEKTIDQIQKAVLEGKFTYEDLVTFYLFRIWAVESREDLSLQAVISVHPECLAEAQKRDEYLRKSGSIPHPLFGMPILVKDNIPVAGLPTTAGAEVLKKHFVQDAPLIAPLKEKGVIILGKANLSEWAYFFCGDCPLGYSALGGQTMNVHGRLIHESGGSSSGSAAAVAANFCILSIGTETSGSIISPASAQSVVGCKPRPGTISADGVIPISFYYDTPGPISKTVIDNAYLYNGMIYNDLYSKKNVDTLHLDKIRSASLLQRKVAVVRDMLHDTLYGNLVDLIEAYGAEIIAIDPSPVDFSRFVDILGHDMKLAIPKYFSTHGQNEYSQYTIPKIVSYNSQDSINRIPYGQSLFDQIASIEYKTEDIEKLRKKLEDDAKKSMQVAWDFGAEVILSLDNLHAAMAAAAGYACITVPAGQNAEGKPVGLTFIGKQEQIQQLYEIAYAFESRTKYRIRPKF